MAVWVGRGKGAISTVAVVWGDPHETTSMDKHMARIEDGHYSTLRFGNEYARAMTSSRVIFALALELACKHAPPPDCSALLAHPHATYGPSSAFGEPKCAMTCEPGWFDCDANETNGCETEATGHAPHTIIELGAFTACATGCERGWYDCDDDMQNGCEQDAACTRPK